MNILLIRGPNNKNALDLSHYTNSEPRGLQILAHFFSEQGHRVKIIDLAIKNEIIPPMENFDLCGISSSCSDILGIKNLAKDIKSKRDIPIFVGGYQVKKTPNLYLSEYIDLIITETNSNTLKELIFKVENSSSFSDKIIGDSKITDEVLPYNSSFTEKYRKDYSYFIYKNSSLIEFYKETDLISSLENNKSKNITFIDMDFFSNSKIVEEFFGELNQSKIKKNFLVYSTFESISLVTSKLSFYKKNGLDSVILYIGKQREKYIELSKTLNNVGINLWVYFDLYPEFSKKDFYKLKEFIGILNPSVVTLYPLNPFYSSKNMERYSQQLLYKNEFEASGYPGYVLIQPEYMSLKEYYIEIIKLSLYSYRKSIIFFPIKYGFIQSFYFFKNSLYLLYKFFIIIKKL